MSPMMYPVVGSLMYSTNRRTVLELIPPKLRKVWKEWDLRLTILVSLFLQIVLSVIGNRRKYDRKIWTRILVWSAYTGADSVASFALGILSSELSDLLDNKPWDPSIELTTFWAQFLVLHMGGPDSITAYALEDNELWTRQLLGLVSQTCGVVYVFILAWTGKASLLSVLSIVMFIAGLIKYGERVWVLREASNERHRKSVSQLAGLEKGTYEFQNRLFKSTQRELDNREYLIKRNEGYIVGVEKCPEAQLSVDFSGFNSNFISDEGKFIIAYELLGVSKRVFADAALTYTHRIATQAVFKNLSVEDAFQVNEIQLGMIYDSRYTKAPLLHSSWGLGLRLVTFLITSSSLVLFSAFLDHKRKYSKIDVSITYVLLVVALLLEIYAALSLTFSDRFAVWLIKNKRTSTLHTLNSFPLLKSPRWSNTMSQYTLLNFLSKKRKHSLPCERYLNIGIWKKNQWNTNVTKELKEMIFRYFKTKADELATASNQIPFTALLPITTNQGAAGQQHITGINWEAFEYKLIIWTIATEVSYYLDREHIPADIRTNCKAIKRISRYLLYLLVEQPSMISAEIAFMAVGFEEISRSADLEVSVGTDKNNKTQVCNNLLHQLSRPVPALYSFVGGRVVLDKASKLVKDMGLTPDPQQAEEKKAAPEPQTVQGRQAAFLPLAPQKVEETSKAEPKPEQVQESKAAELLIRKRWENMNQFWLEMLGYVANKSRGDEHTQQLRRGGEFLTHVWLLMADFGLTHHFQIPTPPSFGKIIAK